MTSLVESAINQNRCHTQRVESPNLSAIRRMRNVKCRYILPFSHQHRLTEQRENNKQTNGCENIPVMLRHSSPR